MDADRSASLPQPDPHIDNPELTVEDRAKIKAFPRWRRRVGWGYKIAGMIIQTIVLIAGAAHWHKTGEWNKEDIAKGSSFAWVFIATGWLVGTPAPLRRVKGPPNIPEH